MTREAGALFHTGAVQAVGKLPINLKDGAIDMLSLSGHKLHGPKGIGALDLRKPTKFRALIWGGTQLRGGRAEPRIFPASSVLKSRRVCAGSARAGALSHWCIARPPPAGDFSHLRLHGAWRHQQPSTK